MRSEVRGYLQVRDAAKNFEEYSSDLLGDRDVRNYRQLPLEADPPRHTLFREAVQPLFMGAEIEKHVPAFEEHARNLLVSMKRKGTAEITADFALPYVIGCLTIIYNRPQDYDEWLAWGPDVWTAETHMSGQRADSGHNAHRERDFSGQTERSGSVLQAYLDRVFDEAERRSNGGEASEDIWDYVARLEVGGSPVNRQEMQGIANVLLAGGRDTVIKLVTGLVWHLTSNSADRQFLVENPNWFNRTIAEMVRFLSPLPKMERVLADQKHLPEAERDHSKYVLLSFVSANYDRDIWADPEVVDIHRERKPHLAFGFGRHSCMGMNITEHEVGAMLRVLLSDWPDFVFVGSPEIEWAEDFDKDGRTIKYIDRFAALNVTV